MQNWKIRELKGVIVDSIIVPGGMANRISYLGLNKFSKTCELLKNLNMF